MRVCSTMWIAVSVDACGLAPPFGGLRWRRRCSLRASGWARRRCAEARAVARQDPQELLVAARRDLRDVLDRGLRQLAEAKLAGGGAHPDPVRRERVSATWLAWQAMRACTSSRSAVAALHHRQRAHLSLADRMQAELSLRASTKALLQRADERPQHVRAQLAVVAQYVAQDPRQRASSSAAWAPPRRTLRPPGGRPRPTRADPRTMGRTHASFTRTPATAARRSLCRPAARSRARAARTRGRRKTPSSRRTAALLLAQPARGTLTNAR